MDSKGLVHVSFEYHLVEYNPLQVAQPAWPSLSVHKEATAVENR